MPHADGSRYTLEEILAGLRGIWRDAYGDDQPIDANTRIVERLRELKFCEEFDVFEFAHTVDRHFICRDLSYRVWRRAFGESWEAFLLDVDPGFTDGDAWEREVVPRLTFGALAEFLIGHVTPPPLERAHILGRSCAPAGAFLAITQIAEKTRPRLRRFAPSTGLRARFRGYRLRELWGLARWLSLNRLPPLRPTLRSRAWDGVRSMFGVLAGLAVFVAVLTGTHAAWGLDVCAGLTLAVITIGALAVTLACINRGLARFENPLPPGFVTFRDLAAGLVQDSPTTTSPPEASP